MPAPPATLPVWATGGTITVPDAAKQALGWIVEIPPHEVFNWWQNLTYQWVDHYNTTIQVEHTIADGTHSDVTADSLDVDGLTQLGDYGAGANDFHFKVDPTADEMTFEDSLGNVRMRMETSGGASFDLIAVAGDTVFRVVPDTGVLQLFTSSTPVLSFTPASARYLFADTSANTIVDIDAVNETFLVQDNTGTDVLVVDAGAGTTTVASGTLAVTDTVSRSRAWHATAFGPELAIADRGKVSYDANNRAQIGVSSAVATIACPVDLAVGVTIEQMDVYINITDTNFDLIVRLVRYTNSPNTRTVLATYTYPGSGVGDITGTDSTVSHTVLSNSSYVLECVLDESVSAGIANGGLHAVELTYDTNIVHE